MTAVGGWWALETSEASSFGRIRRCYYQQGVSELLGYQNFAPDWHIIFRGVCQPHGNPPSLVYGNMRGTDVEVG